MKRHVFLAALLVATACGGGRTTSCQQLYDCCHNTSSCAATANGGNESACLSSLNYAMGAGLCAVDGGPTDAGSDAGPVDGGGGGRDSGPACAMYGADCTTNHCCTGLACSSTMMTCL